MSVKSESDEDLAKKVRQLERQSRELQRSREALQRSEMLFRGLVEKLPFPVAVGTSDLQTLYLNPKFTEIFGYTADDIPDQNAWRQKLMPDKGYRLEKSLEVDEWIRSDDQTATFQRHFTDKSGRLHDIVVHTIKLEDRFYNILEDTTEWARAEEELRRSHLVLEQRVEQRTTELTRANQKLQAEISERRRVEIALRESEEKYRLLVDNANDAIFVTQDGMIKFANPSAMEMTGYSAIELTDLPFVEILHPDDRQQLQNRHFGRMNDEKVAANYTFRILSKAGAELWQQINSVVIRWENRSAILSFVRDITVEKRLERQLIQSQKMKAIGTLAGGIAHDFNNLMTTIQGNVSLMLFDVPSSHPNHQHLVNIEKQIKRGTRLTSQLLGFAKRGQSQIQTVNLNELVAETAEAFGRTNKLLAIHTELAADLLPVEVDRTRIEQALLNLYLNAADTMPRGGKLVLETTNESHANIAGQLYEPRPCQYIRCSICDSGEGMSKESLEQMFDPFYSTKDIGAGSGLGLATVYSIINSHNGYIAVESTLDKGTTFHIYLPAADSETIPAAGKADEIIAGCGTILLVDDEEMVLDVGAQLLEKLGYRVTRAKNGEQAISLFEKDRDLIDLVILDIIMPEMDGAAVFDRLKQIKPDVKVLLASGYSIDGQASGILNRGGSGFIPKPFTLQQLSQKISALLPPAGNKAKN